MGWCPPFCFRAEQISAMIAMPIYNPSTATAKTARRAQRIWGMFYLDLSEMSC
jgi:hypothetical protein